MAKTDNKETEIDRLLKQVLVERGKEGIKLSLAMC